MERGSKLNIILISDKIEFKQKLIIRDCEGHQIHQKDMVI